MPIEHRSPTSATVQFLYAHAFRCAFQDCTRPLYRVDDNTGERTLNSRVCHIAARREGGQRFDPAQTEEQNRTEPNLVLMCQEHHSAIDDRKNVGTYTVDKLLEWKAAQFKEYEQLKQGWGLNASMAEEVLQVSESASGVIIANSTLQLGGEGGKAPGAGGGGGGAIGPNARAGDGGAGGGFREEQGKYSRKVSMLPVEQLFPQFFDDHGNQLGAGGGGGEATGIDAHGGDGGGGGERVIACVDVGELMVDGFDHLNITVGQGVQPQARLFGQRGGESEDSVIDFVSKDGRILKSVRAKCGESGFPGESKFPVGVAELAREDIATGCSVSTLLPANGIEVREGVAYVLSGGWGSFPCNAFPLDVVWHVLIVGQCPVGTLKSKSGFYLSVIRPDGYETSRAAISFDATAAQVHSWISVCSIGTKLDSQGYWKVRAHAAGVILNEVAVLVNLTQPAAG